MTMQINPSEIAPPRLTRKLESLVAELTAEFEDKQVGHCVRVDHLSAEDGLACCRALQEQLPEGVAAYVLSHDRQDALHVPADKAIEIRNRKRTSLCLFVPATLQDAAVSSLGNSFSPFDLPLFLRTLADGLRVQIPDDLSEMVGAVLRQLKGSARVPVEDVIDFLSAVLDAPQPETVGVQLWRVGLIPDFSDPQDLARRLDLNRASVERLARPARAYTGVAERVASLKLAADTIQTGLIQYLMGKRLQSDRGWLRTLTGEPWRGVLSFDHWKFADVEQSELARIDVVPFYQNDGVRAGCGLEQDAPGTVLYARCGAKKAVVVKWQTEPVKLTDVKHWRVEIVPDRDKYDAQEAAGVELPQVTVRGTLRQAKVPLDSIEDVESLEVREVQIRVVGLDTNGSEILTPDTDEPIEGISQSFYLEQNDDSAVDGAKPRRMATERSLPDALLAWAMKARDKERRVTPLPPEDRDLLYLPFQVNDKAVVRVATTVFLRDLERDTLTSYASGGRYAARVSGVDALMREKVESLAVTVGEKLLPAWDRFLQSRKQTFEAIAGQNARGLVVTADLTPALCRHVQRYARSYCDLMDEAMAAAREDAASVTAETVEALLTLDTLTLDFQYLAGPSRATVFLPTHPLRLLWYVAYGEWVSKVEQDLLNLPVSQRAARMSDNALRHVSPLNVPALLVRPTTGEAEVFADNLTLFHAVTLPLTVSDPGTLVSEVARVLGLDGYEASLADLQPDEAAAEVANYLKLHSYLKTLRVSAVNPGAGEFLRAALEQALHGVAADGDEARDEIHLDLITHSASDIQTPAPGLEALSREWYHRGQRQRGNHLRPAVQIARRLLSDENMGRLPGGDVHVSFCLDHYRPTIELRTRGAGHGGAAPNGALPSGTSASVFGLLTRFQTQFTSRDGTAVWERGISFQGDQVAERHPVNRAYSDLLVDTQKGYLTLCGLALGGDPAASPQPALRLEVGPEERRLVSTLHQQSDWLITIDRHFGVEYYDAPQDTYLAKEAGHYLLDYTPEFVDGLGHRLVVTTQWKEEIADILGRAMDELGLARDAANCGDLLTTLKTVSGRLALRLIGSDSGEVGQDTLAKETVSLGVVANYLEHKGELKDAILVPLDAHKRLFLEAKTAQATDSGSRCDLLLVRPSKQRLVVEYIEVKYRQGANPIPSALLDQIADQTTRTEKTLRAMYFAEPPRLDAPILRCQLAAILRFYAERARRHGRMTDDARYSELLDHLTRVEMGLTKLVSKYRGIIVNLNGPPRKTFKHGDITIQVLTGIEVERETDFQVSAATAHGEGIEGEASVVPTEGEAETASEGRLTAQVGTVSTTTDATEPERAAPNPVDVSPPTDGQKRVMPKAPMAHDPRHLIVPLGLSTHSEEEVSWVGSVEGSPHLFVMGIPGQGKSWSVLRLISQVTQQNVPALILDFHGQFSDRSTPFGAAAQPLVLDVAEGLPFSPFEVLAGTGPSQWKTNSFQVAEIIQYLCDLGDMQRDLLYEAIRDSYKAAGFADVGAADGSEPLTPPTMTAVFERLRALEQERKGIKNTAARVRPLFEFDLFREGDAPVNFAETRSRTTVIDLHRVGMETLQTAAGAFVLRKLYKDMFQWGETDRLRLLVVLDEAHRLAKDITLPKLMKEGRKFGIAAVVASQTMQDFHPEVLQNAGTKILYRTNYPQSKKVSGYLKAPHYIPDVVARLEGLAVGHALVQTPKMPTCAEVAMYPYVPEADE